MGSGMSSEYGVTSVKHTILIMLPADLPAKTSEVLYSRYLRAYRRLALPWRR